MRTFFALVVCSQVPYYRQNHFSALHGILTQIKRMKLSLPTSFAPNFFTSSVHLTLGFANFHKASATPPSHIYLTIGFSSPFVHLPRSPHTPHSQPLLSELPRHDDSNVWWIPENPWGRIRKWNFIAKTLRHGLGTYLRIVAIKGQGNHCGGRYGADRKESERNQENRLKEWNPQYKAAEN